MKRIYSEIEINAPAVRIWNIITDFDNYPEWNSFTPRITLANDQFHEGAEFDLDCQMTERQLLTNEHETILEIVPERYRFAMGTSRTRGRPGIKSYRWQICEPVSEEKTRFINFEQFEGPLAPLVYFLYARKLSRAFERFCRDLKQKAEEKE
jgi:uncharacterized protein YndB with AHSA1/START domain